MKSQIPLHIATVAVTGGLALLLRVSEKTLGAMIVLVAAIAFFCWAIGGTIWWLGRIIVTRLHGRDETKGLGETKGPRVD